MAIKKEKKQRILLLVDAGIPVEEVAQDEGVNKGTVYAWLRKRKAEGKEDLDGSIEQIKKQLATLSKRKPTEAVSRKIAMLSASLSRLERSHTKKERSKEKETVIKPFISDITSHEEAGLLKSRALLGEFGELYLYQREFLSCNDQYRLVLKSRQIGFSYVAALDALIAAVAGRNQLFLSASEEQALILIRYVEHWAGKMGIVFSTDKDNEKRLPNGAIIKAMANNFRTVQGFTGDIWMDEFAWYQNPKKIWHAFVPSIGAVQGRFTIMSTPFEEQSLFNDLCTNEEKYFMFTRFRVDIYRAMEDGLKFDLETMRALFDADTWASAYECQFIDDESSLFSISLIKSCVDPMLHYYSPPKSAVLFSGYDIGRTAHRSVLAALELSRNRNIYDLAKLEVIAKAPFDEQRTLIDSFMKMYPVAQLNIDRTGIGMDLAEGMVKRYKQRVKGVHFTATQKEAMALNLKKLFEDGIIRIPNDQLLIADIHAIKRKAGARGFLYDSKQNEHGHADRFWALALAASHIEAIERKQKPKGRGLVIRG